MVRQLTMCLFAVSMFCSSLFGASYVGVQKGLIYQAYVDYNDTDTIAVTAGYGECNGHYWEITEPVLHNMTTLTTSEDFHYIYIDDANSDYPYPEIIDSTVEPAWSNQKLGWYSGNNRCVGVVWNAGNSTIQKFMSTPDCKYVVDNYSDGMKFLLDNGNPTGLFETVDASSCIPVNAIGVRVQATNSDLDSNVWVYVTAYEAYYSRVAQLGFAEKLVVDGWIDLPRQNSRKLKWYGQDNDDSDFEIKVTGFQIHR